MLCSFDFSVHFYSESFPLQIWEEHTLFKPLPFYKANVMLTEYLNFLRDECNRNSEAESTTKARDK